MTTQKSTLPTARAGSSRVPVRSTASVTPQRAADRSNCTRTRNPSTTRSRRRATKNPAPRMTTASTSPGSSLPICVSASLSRSNPSTARLPRRYAATSSTSLPKWSPAAKRSSAARESRSGATLSTTGRSAPLASRRTISANSLALPIVEPISV